MDTKFQTSFIPKKPILMDQKSISHTGGTSVFMFISVIIFILSIVAAAGTFVWKDLQTKNQEKYRAELKKAEARFDSALIEKLKKANTKIDLGNKLFKKHLDVVEMFSIINALTADGITFNSFDFVAPDVETGDLKITMKGFGNSFSSIAWQSDVFGKSSSFGKNRVLKNPILSDLSLDAKGNVGFTFTASISAADVLYEKVLNSELGNTQ